MKRRRRTASEAINMQPPNISCQGLSEVPHAARSPRNAAAVARTKSARRRGKRTRPTSVLLLGAGAAAGTSGAPLGLQG